MTKKASKGALALMFIICLITFISGVAFAGPVMGGKLVYGMEEDPQNWTPHNVVSCQNQLVMAQIWSSLLRYDRNGRIVGDLAESWEWKDDKTLIFKLRKNVKWHNGDPLTADQVVKSENHRLNPEESIDAKNLGEIIEKWTVLDDLTIKLTLKRPDITILQKLTTAPSRAFVLHPDWDEKTSGQSPETTIGTGPFMYKSYEPGVKVTLVRNPNYFIKGMPYLDEIELVILPDSEARMTAIRSGQVHIVEYIDFQAMPMLKKNPDIYVPEGKGFYGSRLLFDLLKPPTNDVKVRKALNFAVNREMIVAAVLAGEGNPIWGGMIPPDRFGYNKDIANYYKYDPAKAKALLAEAGWKDTDGDGSLDKDGKPMVLSFTTYGPSWWSQVAEVIQANFKDIGVTTELDVHPWAEYKEIRAANAKLPEGTPGTVNIIGSSLWGLGLGDLPNYIMAGGYNFNRYNNPEARKLLADALATTDGTKREAMIRQMEAVTLEDAPIITPCMVTRSEVVRKNVKNFYHLNQDGCYGALIWETWLESK